MRTVTATIDDSPLEARLDASDAALAVLAERVKRVDETGGEFLTKLTTICERLQARADQQESIAAALAERVTTLQRTIPESREPLPRGCELNLLDAGCRPDDPEFDNAAPINAALRRRGAGTTSIYLPAGAFYFRTPIEAPLWTGLRLRGNGLSYVLPEGHYGGPRGFGGPASRLVYAGDAATPAVRLHSLGDIWDGVVLQRGPGPDHNRTAPVTDGSIGIEFCGDQYPPQGKTELRSIAILGFDTAIHAAGEHLDGHADESEVGFAWIQDCRTAFRSDGVQATMWHFRTLKVGGQCETVFDWQRGGGMLCTQLSLMAPALVFRLAQPVHHYSSFKISHLRVDSAHPNWRLLDVGRGWLLHLDVWGEIGRGATPAADAIVIRKGDGTPGIDPRLHQLDIRLMDGNTWGLWDWRKSLEGNQR